jgi:hypothetical protein
LRPTSGSGNRYLDNSVTLRYIARIADRIKIPVYGPPGLRYAERAEVLPHLGEIVTEPPTLEPLSVPAPIEPGGMPIDPEIVQEPPEPPGIQINILRLEMVAPELGYQRADMAPIALLTTDPRSRPSIAKVIELRPSDFAEVEHEGLILVLAEASELEAELFDSVGGLAKRLEIRKLPIYVSQLG